MRRERLLADQVAEPEVGQLDGSTGSKQHVGRLHVAVEHALLVGRGKRLQDAADDATHVRLGKLTELGEALLERAAIHELQLEDERLVVGDVEPVERDHVGTGQRPHQPRFAKHRPRPAFTLRPALALDDLEGDVAADDLVSRAVHGRERTGPDLVFDEEVPESLTGLQAQGEPPRAGVWWGSYPAASARPIR